LCQPKPDATSEKYVAEFGGSDLCLTFGLEIWWPIRLARLCRPPLQGWLVWRSLARSRPQLQTRSQHCRDPNSCGSVICRTSIHSGWSPTAIGLRRRGAAGSMRVRGAFMTARDRVAAKSLMSASNRSREPHNLHARERRSTAVILPFPTAGANKRGRGKIKVSGFVDQHLGRSSALNSVSTSRQPV
jgi:hypothetical protein